MLNDVTCLICMCLILNIGGRTIYCTIRNIINLDFAIFRDKVIIFVSSATFLNYLLCTLNNE